MKTLRAALLMLALCTQSPFSFEHFRRRRELAVIGYKAIILKEPNISRHVMAPIKRVVEVELQLTEVV